MITFSCPNCGKQFQVAADYAGKMGKCKSCGNLILVPSGTVKPADTLGVVLPPSMRPAAPPTYAAPQYAPPPQYGPPPYPQPQQYVPPNPYGAYPPQPAGPPPAAYHQPTAYPPPPGGPGYAPPSPYGPAPAAGYAHAPTQGHPQPPPDRTPMRLRRLTADAQQVQKAFANFPLIRVQSVFGEPPERYVLEFRVRGLVRGPQGTPVYKDQHFAEIQLTSEYPRQSPKCRMLTPIFHPNIEPAAICVGDHWTAGERLVDLIIRIAEMIAFQAYNIKSPLDGEAAMWADQHRQHLPIDRRDMHPPDQS